MSSTLYTDINFTTSIAGYFANQLVATGWQIYFQGTNIFSGIATLGTVTIVPEMPDEPSLVVMPPRPTRIPQEVVTPAFSVHVMDQPLEEYRYGLGDSLFVNRVSLIIEGFVVNKQQHMVFATYLRNFFRQDFRIPIWDYENNPVTPNLIDNINTYIDHRRVDRLEFADLPQPVRYYINAVIDMIYFD
jgi:hypothetical protein